ncbi:hypothetical protein LMTR13_26590 [Bradyrhizobium icense]|uniref:Uncharacterized protein n=1 Tax=Bradyrhizobium icense TaxID=1274631 RepID=A0A1B1UKE0_9BRAD|nr:hypothetical protein LMTR13_26590 [Bradyrhizobium icense]
MRHAAASARSRIPSISGALEERSLSERAEAIKSSLGALSDDDRAIIAKGKNFDAADQAVQSWRDGIATVKSGAEGLRTTVASSLVQSAPAPAEPDAAVLQAARAEQQSLLADAQTALDTLRAKASGILESLGPDSPWRQWAASLAAFKGDYNAAVARSSTHAERMT